MAETHPFSPFGGGRGSRREGTVAFVTNYGKRRHVGVGCGVREGGRDAPTGGKSDGFGAKEGKREAEE